MKVTLLGHASVLVELEGATCLMDPVFQDPFEDSAVVSCPRRVVHFDALPRPNVLILSHQHLDHFDIPSIARIPRDVQVLCPKDHVMLYALEQLGFTKVDAAAPFTRIQVGRYELTTTLSSVSNVIELGMIFKDPSGTFWNQVDTVVSASTRAQVLANIGDIDLLFAMYASQNFGFFESKPAAFPYAMHQMNLENVAGIAPKMVVPGSAGFRFAGPGMDWCNSFLFPMARERFLEDVARIAPRVKTCLADPGDVFELKDGEVTHARAASPFAETLEDDTALLRYDPTGEIPLLRDPNPDGFDADRLVRAVDDCLEGLERWLRAAWSSADPLIDEYRAYHVRYAVVAVFPDAREEWFTCSFAGEAPRIEKKATPSAVPPDAMHRIVASALASRAAHDKSFFYLRAFSRKTCNVYALSANGADVRVEPKELRDLLAYYLDRKAPGAELAVKTWLDKQLAPFVKRRG